MCPVASAARGWEMSMMREKCRLRHDDETKANKHRTEKMIAKTFPWGSCELALYGTRRVIVMSRWMC